MTKHLFRVVSMEQPRSYSEMLAVESWEGVDHIMAHHMPVHTFPLPSLNGKEQKGIGPFGRDLIVEWGSALYVRPELLEFSQEGYQTFEEFMRKLEYDKDIIPDPTVSQGGLFVQGDEIILVSDIIEPDAEHMERFVRQLGYDADICYVPSISSRFNGHIDLDYAIVDRARILYHRGSNTERNNNGLETVAAQHSYEFREYRPEEPDLEKLRKKDKESLKY